MGASTRRDRATPGTRESKAWRSSVLIIPFTLGALVPKWAVPNKIAARMVRVLEAVAEAPPPLYSGGGYWQAMHDEMAGFYEVRVDGQPNRTHYRLFCLLERDSHKVGLDGPSIIVIAGKKKPFRTVLSAQDYAEICKLGDEFRSRSPRSVEK